MRDFKKYINFIKIVEKNFLYDIIYTILRGKYGRKRIEMQS